MKTSVRNRMAELLLKSFKDSEQSVAIEWLSVFCKMVARRERPIVRLEELLHAKGLALPRMEGNVKSILDEIIGEGKLLQFRRADINEGLSDETPSRSGDIPWMIEPHPDVHAAWPAVCERLRIYVRLVARMRKPKGGSHLRDPLSKAMAEAASCFNSGLFFEAHEHLEHFWAAQPKGPMKRFLQGIIQISVGFHHACLGKYDGAINQLGKGLEKTLGTTGELIGLDCETFLPKVAATRKAIMKRGRGNMRPMRLSQIPRMRIRAYKGPEQ